MENNYLMLNEECSLHETLFNYMVNGKKNCKKYSLMEGRENTEVMKYLNYEVSVELLNR